MKSFRFFLAIVFVSTSSSSFAADPLIGTNVFWKDTATAKLGDKTINIELIPFPAKVEDVNGEWLWLERAWVKKRDVMDLRTAFDYYVEEVRRNPRSAGALRRRAACWCGKGELTNAIQDYDEAIRLDPKVAVTYNNRGAAKYAVKDYTAAIRDYDEAIRLDPKFAMAYNNRGNAKSDLKDYAAAIRDYDQAIRLDPKYALTYNDRGWLRHVTGDYSAAISDYTESLKIDPKQSHANNNLAFLYATCPDISIRNATLALKLADEVLANEPRNAYALNARACALALQSKFSEAIRVQEQALEDQNFAESNFIVGGGSARQRIAAWKKEELWLTTPEKD